MEGDGATIVSTPGTTFGNAGAGGGGGFGSTAGAGGLGYIASTSRTEWPRLVGPPEEVVVEAQVWDLQVVSTLGCHPLVVEVAATRGVAVGAT